MGSGKGFAKEELLNVREANVFAWDRAKAEAGKMRFWNSQVQEILVFELFSYEVFSAVWL